ncbi:MAG: 3-dehydroquinate synthase, partial [Kiritimatiellaeota bacterium]|nr:3-dehydroquinate synthase [Kiritimatiellota bacterium]
GGPPTPGKRVGGGGGGKGVSRDADVQTLERRCALRPGTRPLLDAGNTMLTQDTFNLQRGGGNAAPPVPKPIAQLLAERAGHYASFATRVTVSDAPPEVVADILQAAAGLYRVSGMGAPYDVQVGAGILSRFLGRGARLGSTTLIVGDTNTAPLYGSRIAGPNHLLTIPSGEGTKHIGTVADIWAAFAKGGVERAGVAIAVGGGVVGDITGFAAATWMRGIRWINVPTTLLAMVDSGIGGKTGVDTPDGKNLVGAFHPPSLVVADTSTLATLPTSEIRCGLAEVIKHAIIGDPGLIGFLPLFACCATTPGHEPCPAVQDAQRLAPFVARAMAVKARIINEDPYERGIRAALNLGHTVGHALEKLSGFVMPHGHAIAIGTVTEARIAEAAGLAKRGFADDTATLFAGVGLPTALPPGTSPAGLLDAMRLDKKTAGGNIRFALPAALGDVRVNQVVDDTLLLHTLDTQRNTP